MTINIQPANVFNPGTSRKFMKSMASNGLARFILLEACVEIGPIMHLKEAGLMKAESALRKNF